MIPNFVCYRVFLNYRWEFGKNHVKIILPPHIKKRIKQNTKFWVEDLQLPMGVNLYGEEIATKKGICADESSLLRLISGGNDLPLIIKREFLKDNDNNHSNVRQMFLSI